MHNVWGVRLCQAHAPKPVTHAHLGITARETGSVCEGQMFIAGAICVHDASWSRRSKAFCPLHVGLCHYKYYGEVPCFYTAVRFLDDDFGYCLHHATKRGSENRCTVITRKHVQCKRFTPVLPGLPLDRQPPYDCGSHLATQHQLQLQEIERQQLEEEEEEAD